MDAPGRVYDAELETIQLYVNCVAQPAAVRGTAVASSGAVQIGRALGRSGHGARWRGDLADVAVYDRMVTTKEIGPMAAGSPVRLAYWSLNARTGDRSPEVGGARSP